MIELYPLWSFGGSAPDDLGGRDRREGSTHLAIRRITQVNDGLAGREVRAPSGIAVFQRSIKIFYHQLHRQTGSGPLEKNSM
jgi:hypothetical protein